MTAFDQLAAGIRDAVAAGEFERARELWAAYSTRLRQELAAGPVAARHLEQAHLLLEWVRPVALAARARAFDEWSALELKQGYSAPARRSRHTVQITG
jgi:hypothetical protein